MKGSLAMATICAKNYLANARVLVDSFLKYNPEGQAYVLITDHIDGYFDSNKERAVIHELEELRNDILELDQFTFQYTILELATAAKPFYLDFLLRTYGIDKLVYFDPDILITHELSDLSSMLNDYSIVLTPHITSSIDDALRPNEIDILRAGAYNLGFIALRNDQTSKDFLHWWSQRLLKQCIVDPNRGYFVDQKWIDLVPGFFDYVKIIREPGYNVAYWNLHERRLNERNGYYSCNEGPLYFFHFSGFSPDKPTNISKYQTRYLMSDIGETAKIFDLYRNLLKGSGYGTIKNWPYAYGYFDNGVKISDIIRQTYLSLGDNVKRFGNPFRTGDGTFYSKSQQKNKQVKILATRDRVKAIYHRVKRYPLIGKLAEIMKPFVQKRLADYPQNDQMQPSSFPSNEIGERSPSPTYGVNLVGYFQSETGLGTAVRSEIDALKKAHIPHVLNNVVDPGSHNKENIYSTFFSDSNPYYVNLIHINADQVSLLARHKGDSYFNGHYNIGYWAWELSEFPFEWQGAFDQFDEVWVPSHFVLDAVSRVSPIPVVRMPHCVTLSEETVKPVLNRDDLGISANTFVYLFMFDFHSFIERKNPAGIIKAFKRVFSPTDNALLVLKTLHSESNQEDLKMIEHLIGDTKIRIIDRVMSREEVNSLLLIADCYVSLHRSEGFGLTMAEAMALGKPVIATAYSGNMDFMTPSNCYLVKYSLIEIDRDHGPYKKGNIWADPDIDDAARLLRHVYDNREDAVRVGQFAANHIKQHFSSSAVSGLYKGRINLVSGLISKKEKKGLQASQRIDRQFLLVTLAEKAVISIDNISVKSDRPFFGWLISLCKRAIRKSTYWLYNPLFTMITQFNQAIITEIAKQSNKNEEAFCQINKIMEDIDDTKNQLRDQRHRFLQQLEDTLRDGKEYESEMRRTVESITARLSEINSSINHLNSRLYSTLYINPGVKVMPKKEFDYFGFEELFRGSSALLKERLKLYVDYFIGHTNILDVGCGRGEFLELMQQSGISASGVDVNPETVALCKGKGLKVSLGDFSSYMDGIPDGSLDGVFSAQFIEHLEPQSIDVFIKKAYKKLAVGGIFVSETVNPYHIANFHFFWVDPTHQRPIYPEVAKFFCWSAGFEDVNLRFFPCFGEIEKNLSEPWDYCDYAVVALKIR